MTRNSIHLGWALRCAAALLVLLALGVLPATAQQQNPRGADGLIEMNFRNVEIGNFLTLMSEAFGIAFVWDEKELRGEVTLVSPRKFKREDALRIFETVLAMQGYTTVQSDGSPVVQVVPIKDASRVPGPTRSGADGAASGQFVTQIIPLRYADANQVRAVLQPMISKAASLVIYAPANVLVVSDNQDNVQRILDIVRSLDVEPGDVEFAVLKLQYASASKLAPILTSLAGTVPKATPQRGRAPPQPQQQGQAPVKIVADERTNTLLVVADPVTVEQLRGLVRALDVPGLVPDSGIKVYRLQHADATELVKILENVKSNATPQGQPPQPNRVGAAQDSFVTADKPTNSLIVFGDAGLIATMDQMVVELDIRRPQVYVEALIMEMSLEKSLQLGVRWQATGQGSTGSVIGGGFPNASPQGLDSALGGGTGAVLGVVGDEIEFQGQSFTSFSGFIQATRQDQDLNILANPQLLTLNNEEAEINVSQVIPVSAKVVTNSNLQTTTEFEFKDVGVILTIRPQITGNDKVRLLIKQESSSVASRQAAASSDQQAITTLKRSINTQVLVDNNNTVAIGGLIQDQIVESESKVPCLGDIPLLGWLFKSRTEELRKTNLIVFIRPRIITSQADLREISDSAENRYDRSRDITEDPESLLRGAFDLRSNQPPAGEGAAEGTQAAPAEQSE